MTAVGLARDLVLQIICRPIGPAYLAYIVESMAHHARAVAPNLATKLCHQADLPSRRLFGDALSHTVGRRGLAKDYADPLGFVFHDAGSSAHAASPPSPCPSHPLAQPSTRDMSSWSRGPEDSFRLRPRPFIPSERLRWPRSWPHAPTCTIRACARAGIRARSWLGRADRRHQ